MIEFLNSLGWMLWVLIILGWIGLTWVIVAISNRRH